MNSDKIKAHSIKSKATLINTLKIMDERRLKSLLVFEKETFIGLITIGDIQRAIIANIELTSTLSKILEKSKKIYAKEGQSIESIKKTMLSFRAECMPVLNDEGKLVSVYYWEDFFDIDKKEDSRKINLPTVIMAGGYGTRLKPLTNVIPKPMIPINEKTILELIMDQFISIGCSKFYLSVNYKYEMLQFYLKNLPIKYDVTLFKEDKPLGTIGSVSLLKGKIDTPFFLSNCDIIIDQNYIDVYDYHKENGNEITIVTAVKSYEIPYGVIETGKNGLMKNISEKPEITYMINTGVYLIEPTLIDEIPVGEFFHITELIEKVKNSGRKVGTFPVSEKSWIDIGDWNEYLRYIKTN